MQWSTDFFYSIRFDEAGGATVSSGAGTAHRVKVEHQTKHYVVIRSEGSSYSDRGQRIFINGSIEILEFSGGQARKPIHRCSADRTWRTQVKAAIAKADEAEAAWEAMNATREAAQATAQKAEEAAVQHRAEVDRVTAAIAESACMNFAIAHFKSFIASVTMSEMSPEDVSRIIQRAVANTLK